MEVNFFSIVWGEMESGFLLTFIKFFGGGSIVDFAIWGVEDAVMLGGSKVGLCVVAGLISNVGLCVVGGLFFTVWVDFGRTVDSAFIIRNWMQVSRDSSWFNSSPIWRKGFKKKKGF